MSNNWNGEGFPPVGTICVYNYEERPYEIIAHRDGYAIGWRSDVVTIASKDPKSFKPIKSDRDKAIEDMSRIFYQRDLVVDESFGALYDAGYRKINSEK